MIHPDGSLMCHCNNKKANWYVKRGLAIWLDDKQFQLKFAPSGHGKSNSAYYTQELENRCVVCGVQESEMGLNKHHVVPYVFRSRFPVQYKESNHHDILPTCVNCHEAYEDEANDLKQKLALKVGVSINSPLSENEQYNKKILSARKVIDKINNKELIDSNGNLVSIPEEKIQLLKEKASKELLPGENKKSGAIWADKIMLDVLNGDINNLWNFIRMWRAHFIEHAQPQFLPKHWSVDHPLEIIGKARQN